jgi:flavorubredoxin
MKAFIDGLVERNYQNRFVGFIENGSWAPMATKKMKAMLEGAKDLTLTECGVKILSSVSDTNAKEIEAIADEILGFVK